MASDGEELTLAASSGDADRVASLLAAGADVDSIREDGSSSLLLAALGPYVEVVKVLLEHGANVGLAKANGSTPIFAAAASDAEEIVKLLAATTNLGICSKACKK